MAAPTKTDGDHTDALAQSFSAALSGTAAAVTPPPAPAGVPGPALRSSGGMVPPMLGMLGESGGETGASASFPAAGVDGSDGPLSDAQGPARPSTSGVPNGLTAIGPDHSASLQMTAFGSEDTPPFSPAALPQASSEQTSKPSVLSSVASALVDNVVGEAAGHADTQNAGYRRDVTAAASRVDFGRTPWSADDGVVDPLAGARRHLDHVDHAGEHGNKARALQGDRPMPIDPARPAPLLPSGATSGLTLDLIAGQRPPPLTTGRPSSMLEMTAPHAGPMTTTTPAWAQKDDRQAFAGPAHPSPSPLAQRIASQSGTVASTDQTTTASQPAHQGPAGSAWAYDPTGGDMHQPDFLLGRDTIDALGMEPVRGEPGGLSTTVKPLPQTAPAPNAQIALQIAHSQSRGIDRMSVQLHPAELGAVEIRLNFAEDGRVSALIAAERPETLDLLQRDSRTLERSLNDNGLRLDSGGLTFTLKQDQQQQDQGFNSSAQHRSQAYRAEEAREQPTDNGSEIVPARVTGLRLLDIST